MSSDVKQLYEARQKRLADAIILLTLRGHTFIHKQDKRYFHFSTVDTSPDDVLWIRENVPALDRFTIRLTVREYPLTRKKRRTP